MNPLLVKVGDFLLKFLICKIMIENLETNMKSVYEQMDGLNKGMIPVMSELGLFRKI